MTENVYGDGMKNNNYNRESLVKFIIYTFIMLLSTIYIIYRAIYTLPIKYGIISLICGIIVLLLEVLETIDFSIYFFNILQFNKNNPELPKIQKKEYPEVDVFIATINESEEILEETIKSCLEMKYPDKKKIHIYICDDGSRKNIKLLANKYNINYISRSNNNNAKAGNYNHALKITSSPYIATFDADMKPTSNFLIKTIPFLVKDKKVGFVQTPQSFNNPDIFQLRLGLSNSIPFEQDYFYKRIELAKNKTNSTIYCGTNAVLSRKALEDTSGFALNTITEDIATGMLIESKGYKGIAISDIVAHGYAVNDIDSFFKQRSRWGRGSIQILKNHKIIGNKGLTIRQKMDYLASIFYWFYGVRRMLYLIIPLLFSLFGIIVINFNLIFIDLFFSQYLLKRIALDLLEDNKRSSTWQKIYEIILAPIMVKEILKELFGFGSTKFEVTSKNKATIKMTKTNKKLLCYHLTFLVFSIIGLGLSVYKSYLLGVAIYIFPMAWIISNIFYLSVAIIFDLSINPPKYNNFIPNKVNSYGFKSIINIFVSLFKPKMEIRNEESD